MKIQARHIESFGFEKENSNVEFLMGFIFDYSPFGAPLDGRTIDNIFHQDALLEKDTIVKTIYVLEEMFETASDWEVINSSTEVTYPSGRMRVRNSNSARRTIGVKKDFTTGTGEHTVSFDITLPMFSCIEGVVMGASSTDSLESEFNASDTIVGAENYQILSYPSEFYGVVEIRDENNAIVLKDSTNMISTHSYTFSAPQGKEYSISFYSNRFCPGSSFHIDNAFISYDTLEVVTGNVVTTSDTLFIINNDFENPVIEPNGPGVIIDGWRHYHQTTTLDVENINNNNWLKVVSTVGSHGAHQAFSVEPGETYTFEIDLHRPSGMNKEINVVIWKSSGPSGALSVHVLNVDGTNTFTYNATSSDIFVQIRQAGTYYLDNIRMYRVVEETVVVEGVKRGLAYRYGFNSMERDNEIKGKGNSYDFGARIYDPRVGRWLSIDPQSKRGPSLSPYVHVFNSPISYKDPNGDWGVPGAVVGGVTSALVETSFQMLNSMFFEGKDFHSALKLVDKTDVLTEFVSGAAMGFIGVIPVDKVSKLFRPRYRKAFKFMVQEGAEALNDLANSYVKAEANGDQFNLSSTLENYGFSTLARWTGSLRKTKYSGKFIENSVKKYKSLVGKSRNELRLAESSPLNSTKAKRHMRRSNRFKKRAINTAVKTYKGMTGEMFSQKMQDKIVSETTKSITSSYKISVGNLEQKSE